MSHDRSPVVRDTAASRTAVTLEPSTLPYLPGQVLVDAGGGRWARFDGDNGPAAAVLRDHVYTLVGPRRGTALTSDATVRADRLLWDAAVDQAGRAAGLAALASAGIVTA